MSAWPARLPDPEEPMSIHVRDIATANIRTQLRDEFENFIGRAEFDSLWLLWDTLNSANGGDNLAEAFNHRFREGEAFVKVPRQHTDRVDQFLKTLGHTEGKVA
jgi:hypothetical protein